jgi:hypothetical protein
MRGGLAFNRRVDPQVQLAELRSHLCSLDMGVLSCPPNFVFHRSMVSIETGRMKSAEDSEAGVHG